MTEQQALLKLTTLCTQAEHCSQEMIDKMKKWELPEDAIARNMEFLTQKKFIFRKKNSLVVNGLRKRISLFSQRNFPSPENSSTPGWRTNSNNEDKL